MLQIENLHYFYLNIFLLDVLQGHYIVLEKKSKLHFDICNIIGVIIQNSEICIHSLLNKQAALRGENKAPRTLFEARKRWQGPPNINQVKQNELVAL